jgi:hypothetical protein
MLVNVMLTRELCILLELLNNQALSHYLIISLANWVLFCHCR